MNKLIHDLGRQGSDVHHAFDGKYRKARVITWQAQHNSKAERKTKRLKKIANASRRGNRK